MNHEPPNNEAPLSYTINKPEDVVNLVIDDRILSNVKNPTQDFLDFFRHHVSDILFNVLYKLQEIPKMSIFLAHAIQVLTSKNKDIRNVMTEDENLFKIILDFPKHADETSPVARGCYCKVLEQVIIMSDYDYLSKIKDGQPFLRSLLDITYFTSVFDFLMNFVSTCVYSIIVFLENNNFTDILLEYAFAEKCREQSLRIADQLTAKLPRNLPLVKPLLDPNIMLKLLDLGFSRHSCAALEVILSVHSQPHPLSRPMIQAINNEHVRICNYILNTKKFDKFGILLIYLLISIVNDVYCPIENYVQIEPVKIDYSTKKSLPKTGKKEEEADSENINKAELSKSLSKIQKEDVLKKSLIIKKRVQKSRKSFRNNAKLNLEEIALTRRSLDPSEVLHIHMQVPNMNEDDELENEEDKSIKKRENPSHHRKRIKNSNLDHDDFLMRRNQRMNLIRRPASFSTNVQKEEGKFGQPIYDRAKDHDNEINRININSHSSDILQNVINNERLNILSSNPDLLRVNENSVDENSKIASDNSFDFNIIDTEENKNQNCLGKIAQEQTKEQSDSIAVEPDEIENQLGTIAEETEINGNQLGTITEEPDEKENQLETITEENPFELDTITEEPDEEENQLETITEEPDENPFELDTIAEEPDENKNQLGTIAEEPDENGNQLGTITEEPDENGNQLGTIAEEPDENPFELDTIAEEPDENKNQLGTIAEEPDENENQLGTITEEPDENENQLGTITEEPDENGNQLEAITEGPDENPFELNTITEEPEKNENQLETISEESTQTEKKFVKINRNQFPQSIHPTIQKHHRQKSCGTPTVRDAINDIGIFNEVPNQQATANNYSMNDSLSDNYSNSPLTAILKDEQFPHSNILPSPSSNVEYLSLSKLPNLLQDNDPDEFPSSAPNSAFSSPSKNNQSNNSNINLYQNKFPTSPITSCLTPESKQLISDLSSRRGGGECPTPPAHSYSPFNSQKKQQNLPNKNLNLSQESKSLNSSQQQFYRRHSSPYKFIPHSIPFPDKSSSSSSVSSSSSREDNQLLSDKENEQLNEENEPIRPMPIKITTVKPSFPSNNSTITPRRFSQPSVKQNNANNTTSSSKNINDLNNNDDSNNNDDDDEKFSFPSFNTKITNASSSRINISNNMANNANRNNIIKSELVFHPYSLLSGDRSKIRNSSPAVSLNRNTDNLQSPITTDPKTGEKLSLLDFAIQGSHHCKSKELIRTTPFQFQINKNNSDDLNKIHEKSKEEVSKNEIQFSVIDENDELENHNHNHLHNEIEETKKEENISLEKQKSNENKIEGDEEIENENCEGLNNDEITKTLVFLIDAFFENKTNSFLHNSVIQLLTSLFDYTTMTNQIIIQAQLPKRILDICYSKDKISASFWGQLHLMAEFIKSSPEVIPDDLKEKWDSYIENKYNVDEEIMENSYGYVD